MRDKATSASSPPTVIGDDHVREIVRRILTVVSPARVILFGSAATGTMGPDSDVDLLVVTREVTDPHEQVLTIRHALAGLPFSFDVMVMARDRFEETRGVIGGIAWPAARHGKVIYEAA